jgi:hypothetical protein
VGSAGMAGVRRHPVKSPILPASADTIIARANSSDDVAPAKSDTERDYDEVVSIAEMRAGAPKHKFPSCSFILVPRHNDAKGAPGALACSDCRRTPHARYGY